MAARLKPSEIRAVLRRLEAGCPEAHTALRYETPFQLLVAVILSGQSTDEQVNRVTPALFRDFPTAAAMAASNPREIGSRIRSVGIFRQKARNLVATAKIVAERYGGMPPRTREELEQLPGVGRKTANVVLSQAWGEDAIAVDTHVFRVANRIGLANAKTRRATEEDLQHAIPPRLWSVAHHWLIHHGRTLCTARRPRCEECPLTRWCFYYGETCGPTARTPGRKTRKEQSPAQLVRKTLTSGSFRK